MMNRSVQANLGGGEHPPARYRADTLRELPSGSILLSAGPAFKRGQLTQSAIDVGALCFGALFICAFAAGFGLLGYVLFLLLVG